MKIQRVALNNFHRLKLLKLGFFSNFIFAFVCIIIAAGALIAYAVRPPSDSPEGGGIFTVQPGQSLKSVGTDLVVTHYIRSRITLATLVTFFGGEHSISPGDYAFTAGENTLGIARQIALGAHNLEPIKVTIPEGDTVQDISDILAKKLPDFDKPAFLTAAKADEGYLFPETYFFYPKTSADEIRKDMRSMFDRQTAGLSVTSSVVVLASLVEGEAHGSDDRAVIAGILTNRLAIGMPLQVDVSVSYDTYKNKGLPPTPINNPGLEAIKAALNPAKTDYLYYLHDSHGTIHYAKTYAEHQRNIAKYLK